MKKFALIAGVLVSMVLNAGEPCGVSLACGEVPVAGAMSESGEPVRAFMSHRGVHLRSTLCGENSLEAATYAKRAGFWCVETDTRYTSDSVLVIMHDAKLNRTCVRADGSPLDSDVFVADVSFEELRRDYRLKADRPEFRVQIPTLEEYLLHCKSLGFIVFIEPKLNDPTGRYYLDIMRVADAALGRDGYVITSNNYANKVIREVLGITDVRLMGLLYQTTWDEMASLGNTVFAISSTAFSRDSYFANISRALSESRAIQTACTLLSQKPSIRFDTQDRLNAAGDCVNYVATDLAAPDWHGQGKTVLRVRKFSKLDLSKCPVLEFGGIYVDMTLTGSARITVAGDSFTVSSSSAPRRIRYQRMFYDSVPICTVEPLSEDFTVSSCDVRIVQF